MFNTIFLITFSICLIVTNIIFFIRKQYLYLFIPCMLFLPEYYGLEISNSLPLLTVTRMMFLIFYLYVVINKKITFVDACKEAKMHIANKTISPSIYFLSAYFILRIISNLHYITTYSQAVKTIFELIFEQLLLVIAIFLLAPTRADIIKLIKIIVWAATFLFLIGILESLTSLRPFDALYTVNRQMLNEHYYRFLLLRSTTTMGLTTMYGNMCLLVFPLILFTYNETKQSRYILVFVLNLLALIHSGSRADILFYFVILVLYIICILISNNNIKAFIKNFITIAFCSTAIISVLCLVNPTYHYFYDATAKSVLNEIGFNFDLTQNAPVLSDAGIGNQYGTSSRLAQFTGIYYTFTKNPIWGLGSGAQDREEIYYYSKATWAEWHPSSTYDVGYVQSFCDEGIIGFAGYISLFLFFVFLIHKKNNLRDYILYLIPVTYALAMLATANMYAYLFTFIIICGILHKRYS